MPPPEVLLLSDADRIADAMEMAGDAGVADDPMLAVLDEAVFDIYDLNCHERVVVMDGLDRAKREYKKYKMEADIPVTAGQIRFYTLAFLDVINAWQTALNRQLYSAEIFSFHGDTPLRVVRFFDDGRGVVIDTHPDSKLGDLLSEIGARIRLPIAEQLSAVRELRVHADSEVLVIKPAARRYWTRTAGLNDADSALGDGLRVASG